MDTLLPSAGHEARPPEPAPAPVTPKKEPGPAARAAAERRATEHAEQSASLMPGRLVVEKDERAGRFVQTLMDFETKEVRWRYPSEAQLAYSRAVAAMRES
jgi:hypothetical protein